jgi:hypothetical protein
MRLKPYWAALFLFLPAALFTGCDNSLGSADPDALFDPPEITLNYISISALPAKLEYELNESSNWTGLEITGHYSDGSSKIETFSNADLSGFDSSYYGTKTITVAINGKSVSFNVLVKPALESISISSLPAKLEYELNESPDWTGLEITGRYSDWTTKVETFSNADISGFDSSSAGTKTIIVTINEKSATFSVTVWGKGTGDVSILVPSSDDISITIAPGTTNTLTATAGYSGYQWYVDDIGRPADNESNGRALTLTVPAYTAGQHRVRVLAYKQGLPYSGEIILMVN